MFSYINTIPGMNFLANPGNSEWDFYVSEQISEIARDHINSLKSCSHSNQHEASQQNAVHAIERFNSPEQSKHIDPVKGLNREITVEQEGKKESTSNSFDTELALYAFKALAVIVLLITPIILSEITIRTEQD